MKHADCGKERRDDGHISVPLLIMNLYCFVI
jgi:hypothetical protein